MFFLCSLTTSGILGMAYSKESPPKIVVFSGGDQDCQRCQGNGGPVGGRIKITIRTVDGFDFSSDQANALIAADMLFDVVVLGFAHGTTKGEGQWIYSGPLESLFHRVPIVISSFNEGGRNIFTLQLVC